MAEYQLKNIWLAITQPKIDDWLLINKIIQHRSLPPDAINHPHMLRQELDSSCPGQSQLSIRLPTPLKVENLHTYSISKVAVKCYRIQHSISGLNHLPFAELAILNMCCLKSKQLYTVTLDQMKCDNRKQE